MNTHARSWVSMNRILPRLVAVVLCVCVLFVMFAETAAAATGVPRIMNYQGRLMSSSGALLGGSGTDYCVKFSLYDDASVGGPDTKLWPSGSPSTTTVNVKNGIFNAGVGDTNAGGDTLDFNFEDNDAVYLNVEVAAKVGPTCAFGDGAEVFENLSPRQRVTASGYAINSATLGGKTGSFYQANSYSTTSAAYDLSTYSKGYFFSTTSVVFWDSTQYKWATTSSDAWFATKTTDQLTQGSTNLYYSNSLVNSFIGSSSTIPKTYTGNTFTGVNSFTGDVTLTNASTTNFDIANTISGAGLTSCSSSSDKLVWNATTRQFGCGADAGAGGGITAIGAQYSVFQTGASQTLATTSDTNIGITITSAGDTQTFTPTWSGTLAGIRGGTGIGSVSQNGILIGAAGNTWSQVSTSSLGLPTFANLSSYLGLSAWYATTTDALAEGLTNKYYSDSRVASVIAGTTTDALAQGSVNKYYADALVQTYLGSVNKGFFFSTTSASQFASVGLAFSTTSAAYFNAVNPGASFSTTSASYFSSLGLAYSTTSTAFNLSTYDKGYFFSTTSVAFWDSTQFRWATTSSDAWFATKSTTDLAEGSNLYYTPTRVAGVIAGTTTDALAEGSTNKYYSNSLVNSFIGASTTIPKTFTNNTFIGVNSFANITFVNATSTSFFSNTLTSLAGSFGTLSATTSTLLASTTAQGRFITGNFISTSTTATSTINGPLAIGISSPNYLVSVLGQTTGPTSATGTAIFAISNDNNTLSSANNVLRLNIRTAYGTACVTGTTCPRFQEYFAGVGSGSDTGGRGVGSLRLSTAGTGITQTSGAADFAEYMQLSESAAVGDIVSLNSDGEYRKAIAGESLIGVISDNPAFVGNANLEGETNAYIVGFAGVIRTTVSAANGPINAGDLIAASDVPGVGIKLSKSGYALGQALESYSGLGNGTISILVLPKFVDATIALENYGGGASGASGYWDLSTSTNTISLASSTYALSVAGKTTLTNATSTTFKTNVFSLGGIDYLTSLTGSGLSNAGGVLTLDRTGDWTGTFGGRSGAYYLANSFSTTSAAYFASAGLAFSTTSAQYFASQNGSASYSTTSTAYQLSTIDKGYFYSTSSSDFWKTQNNFFSTSSTDFWKTQNNFFSTTSASNFSALGLSFSTTSAAYFLGQNDSSFASSSADYYLNASTTVPKTYSNNSFSGTNSFQNVSATNATTTTSFTGTASSTNLYSNIANIGSLIAGAFTGNVITATNATTTTLYTGTASSTNSYSNTATVGSANIGSLTLGNALTGVNGGTGLNTVTQGSLLIGGAGNTWTQVSTSSLGLPTFANLSSYLGLSAWYATTTDALAEGLTNKYYTDSRVASVIAGTTTDALAQGSVNKYYADALVQTYLNSVNKGFFFSTTSASQFASVGLAFSTTSAAYFATQNQGNAFSTTSAAYNLSTYDKGYFFSTTSVAFWDSTQFRWATTSSDAWLATKSTSNLAEGSNLYYTPTRVASVIAGTTTDALAEGSTNKYYSNGLVNSFVGSSTTIPKTFTNNTFTGTNSFGNVTATGATTTALSTNSASTSNLVVSTIQNSMLYTGPGGVVTGATISGPLSFSAGTLSIQTASASQAGALAAGDFSAFNSRLSTSSLGLIDKGFFFSTTSANVFSANGLAFSTTSTDYWRSINNFFSTTSASHFSSLGLAFSTTSASTFLGLNQGQAFSTTSASNFAAAGLAFSTTSAAYYNSQTAGASFSTTSTDYWKTQNNFFSTTSASAFLALNQGNAYSTTSAAYNLSTYDKGYFFSSTSVAFWDSTQFRWATTSSDAWLATKSTSNLAEGSNLYYTPTRVASVIAGTTTDALAEGSTNKYYSNGLVNSFVGSSTTIPKTFTNNTFIGTNSFGNISAAGATTTSLSTNSASTSNLVVSTIQNSMLYTGPGGVVTAATISGPLQFSAGTLSIQTASASQAGALAAGDFSSFNSRLSTSSLGLIDKGFFFSTTSTDYWKTQSSFFSTSSTDFWKTQNNFFSTTSASHFSSLGLAFSTTSAATFLGLNQGQAFSTTSASNFAAAGLAFSTTSAAYYNSQTAGASFSTTSTDYWKTQNNFFSTTSASAYLALNQGNAYSTTSAAYNLSTYDKGYFFSSTSVAFWDSTQFRWATTSSDAWLATKSTSNLAEGSNLYYTPTRVAGVIAGTTTDALAEGSTNKYYSNSLVNGFVAGSTTIAKTFTNNTFTGTNSFQNVTATGATTTSLSTGIASTTNLVVSGVSNGLLGTGANGVVQATTFSGPLSYNGGILTLTQSGAAQNGYLSSTDWNSFNSRLSTSTIALIDKGFFFSTTSASNFAAAGLAFSTTSAAYYNSQNTGASFSTTSTDYYKSVNNFFSTSSASFFSANGLAFSTTSTDYYKSLNNFFSTTSASHFSSLGLAFSTTSASTFLGLNQGQAFSTTSASNFAAAGLAFSTTSAAYNLSQNQGAAFSTTSASYHLSQNQGAAFSTTSANTWAANGLGFSTTSSAFFVAQGLAFSTTSANAWAGFGLGFSTTSSSYFLTQNRGQAFSTTSASYFSSLGLAFSTTSANAWAGYGLGFSTTSASYFSSVGLGFATSSADAFVVASTSIPKTYSTNTFIGVNNFANITVTGATTTSLFSGVASSTNIFASTARFGSLGAFSLTGSVAAAANSITGINIASTTDLWISNIRNGLLSTNGQGNVVASSTPTAASFNATSNTVASQLPYASSTALSALQQISIGAANGTILQGGATGTSTIAGVINVTGTNSTSTFSGGINTSRLNITGAGTSTAAWGMNIANGCYAINGTCISGAVNSVTATNTSLTVNPNAGNVGISLNLSNPNLWTGLQQFGNATSSLFEATQFYARTIQSTSSNALVLRSNLSSTAGLTFGSTSTPQVLGIDTINNRVTLGTGGGTPSLLVLDNKNTPGDPSGLDGAMYFNSSTGIFRCYNGGWVTCGGEAASSTGDVQFRNIDGSFTATSNFNWSRVGNGLTLTGSSTSQTLDLFTIASSSGRAMFGVNGMGVMSLSSTTDPVTPPSGELNIYAKQIAGRMLPKWIGSAGVDTPFQASLGFNRTSMIMPAGGATATTFVGGYGSTFTNVVTTAANPTPATTNLLTSTRRATFSTSATANTITSHRQSALQVTRGNASNIGGFFYTIRFGTSVTTTGNRVFVGLSDSVAAPANLDPLVTGTGIGRVGMATNLNTGNWSFVQNVSGTGVTAFNLGANFPVDTTSLYELILYSKPNDTVINYRITNLSTGAQISSTTNATNLPSNTTYLAPQFWMVNVQAAIATFDFGGWYLESDQ